MNPFTYTLPEERIAQRPIHPPDAAKMLVYRDAAPSIVDSEFSAFVDFVQPGDLIVFNDSKVIPSRFFGTLPSGGEAEVLLLQKIEGDTWRALGRPLKKFREGTQITVSDEFSIEVIRRTGEQEIIIKVCSSEDSQSAIQKIGHMPIPPYIRGGRSDEEDQRDYQSVFAKIDGSVAAPTASLHFTPELIENLKQRGALIATTTLHVGAASFLALWEEGESAPVKRPGSEQFIYSEELIQQICATKQAGRNVIAVGTTVVRALETMMRMKGQTGDVLSTELFIEPGFEFLSADRLVTNFHQPRTTHLLLVEAFVGYEALKEIYRHALASDYRFLSYGDGMLLYKKIIY